MQKSDRIIAPSILAADPGAYGSEIRDIAALGADWIHIDVMDGTFVPPITFGDNIVRVAKANCNLFLDVHLMIVSPEKHIKAFKDAGADRLTVHQEACPDLRAVVQEIKGAGLCAGVAVNPATPVSALYSVLDVADLVLIMTVNPGWGGQPFTESCVQKIKEARGEIEKRGLKTLIEVDGGINDKTAARCAAAGAEVFVAGSYIFGSKDRRTAIAALR